MPIYGLPLPSAGAVCDLANAARSQGPDELADLAQIVLSSTRELGDAYYFATPETKALVATWGMHMDFGPDASGGAKFPFMESFSDMENGMSVVEGGASKMPEALAGIVRENGGEVRTGSEVTRVLTEGGRATGVELAGARVHPAVAPRPAIRRRSGSTHRRTSSAGSGPRPRPAAPRR